MAPQVRKASRDRLVLLELLVLPAPRDRRVIPGRRGFRASKARREILVIQVFRVLLGQKGRRAIPGRRALLVLPAPKVLSG